MSSCISACFRLLESELRRLQKVSEMRETELQAQVNALKAETERQNKLIGQVSKLLYHWAGE